MLKAIDISSLQPHPNLTGVDVVAIKASEGHSYANPDRAEQAKAVRAGGKQIIWYHFLWPENVPAQVAWFLKCAAPRPGDVLALDWETTTAKTAATCAEKDQFLDLLHAARPDLRRLLYCNLSFWKTRDASGRCGDGLWIADPDAPAGHPRVTHPWVVHQYGIVRGTDVDVVNAASVQAWKEWAGVPAQKPPAKPKPPAPYTAPAFPAGLAPGRSRPSAKSLQRALRAAGFLKIADKDLADTYGPLTQAAVGRFFAAHPQFRDRGKPHDVAIGPVGWKFLFTLAYGRK